MVFKAVLFDLDGTLIRTMEDNFWAWNRALSDYGAHISAEQFYPLEGLKIKEMAKRIIEILNVDNLGENELIRQKEEYFITRNRFQLYLGVDGFTRELKQANIPMGIVTGGSKIRIKNTVPSEFLSRFNIIVTGDGEESKPSPAIYVKAAGLLKVEPKECIAVENSCLGVQSAKDAGMFCIAITSTLGEEYLRRADVILDSFSKCRKIIMEKL